MTFRIEALPENISNRRTAEHEATRRLLHELTGSDIVAHDEVGAPYIKNIPQLQISISHCKKAVAVAVDKNEAIGIDIESRRNISEALIQRVFTKAEQEEAALATDPQMHLLQIWTRKEAVLKCKKTGITGFKSMLHATADNTIDILDIATGIPDVVASLAKPKR